MAAEISMVLRFKRAEGTYENCVSCIAGKFVHTDIILHEAGSDSRFFAFSAYMGRPFGMYMVSTQERESNLFTNIAISLSKSEYTRCTSYLAKWVERKLPYNYSDTLIGIPICGHGGEVSNTMFSDVDGSDPNNLNTVFCSQAAALVIRECLDAQGEHHDVVKRLKTINSRLISPNDLYHILYDQGALTSNESLFAQATLSQARGSSPPIPTVDTEPSWHDGRGWGFRDWRGRTGFSPLT